MKRLLLALALLTQIVACETTRVSVRDVERMRFHAMVQNDLKSLAPLLSEDLVYVHTDGAVESKAEFLQRLRSGALRYRSIEPTDVRVRTFGSTAIVTGRSQMAVTIAGADREFAIRYTAVYVVRGDRWQLVSWQSTRIQP
jgi:ketosteroid isomerase-like protein